MAKISEHLKEWLDFESMLWGTVNDSCIITWKKRPSHGWFFCKDGWFCIASSAIENKNWIPWFVELWIVIGDALRDSILLKSEYDEAIKSVLGNIEQWIRYTLREKHSRRESMKQKRDKIRADSDEIRIEDIPM